MPKTEHDEYNWPDYTREYTGQYHEMRATAGDNGSDFLITEWSQAGVSGNFLSFHDKLHGNWREIYTAAWRLQPRTAYECGCGGMYHLVNLRKLLPEATLGGCDLLQSQIDFGVSEFKLPKDITDNITVRDFSEDGANQGLGKWDMVFTQAVLMHLSTEKAMRFLWNMSLMANKWIVVMEGWKKHNYEQMATELKITDRFDLSRPNVYTNECLLFTVKARAPSCCIK